MRVNLRVSNGMVTVCQFWIISNVATGLLHVYVGLTENARERLSLPAHRCFKDLEKYILSPIDLVGEELNDPLASANNQGMDIHSRRCIGLDEIGQPIHEVTVVVTSQSMPQDHRSRILRIRDHGE